MTNWGRTFESHEDFKLKILQKMATMAEGMTAPGKVCIRQLTKDTGKALSNLCRGLIDVTDYLLNTGNDYVIFGLFTTEIH